MSNLIQKIKELIRGPEDSESRRIDHIVEWYYKSVWLKGEGESFSEEEKSLIEEVSMKTRGMKYSTGLRDATYEDTCQYDSRVKLEGRIDELKDLFTSNFSEKRDLEKGLKVKYGEDCSPITEAGKRLHEKGGMAKITREEVTKFIANVFNSRFYLDRLRLLLMVHKDLYGGYEAAWVQGIWMPTMAQ